MATFTKVLLSGSTNGKPIKVVATATAGTTLHTAVTGTTSIDEVWLWCANTTNGALTLTVEWGGVTDPDNLLTKAYSIPANSAPTLIAPGLPLNNALVIAAFASSANVLTVTGFVNRITPS